jgi:N-acetylmuramoyl-L-alanine amidase
MSEYSTRKSRRPRIPPVPQSLPEVSRVRRWAIALFEHVTLLGSVSAVVVAIGLMVLAVLVAFGIFSQPITARGAVGLVLPPTPTVTMIPTALPTAAPPPDIAILAGHWSRDDPRGVTTIHDTGALCPDGLREVTINKAVADKVISILQGRGYRVDLLEEFDARLKSVSPDYAPTVFLSIHSDSCVSGPDYPFATGFKIAHAEPSENPPEDDRLVACLRRDYQIAVDPFKLAFNENTITTDMTAYHAFHEIVPTTPAAIIELGFMANDRWILTGHQEELARGLALGLIAFLRGDRCGSASPTPTPSSP